MRTTAAEHRAKQRRVLAWSLGGAVVLHGVAFALLPGRASTPHVNDAAIDVSSPRVATGERVSLEVRFGPPTISAPDGVRWKEPPGRRLQTLHVTTLPAGCEDMFAKQGARFGGDVRLVVRESGFVDAVELTRPTGFACGDAVLRSVAGALRYHWLPNERFPAPVDLVQPVNFGVVRGP